MDGIQAARLARRRSASQRTKAPYQTEALSRVEKKKLKKRVKINSNFKRKVISSSKRAAVGPQLQFELSALKPGDLLATSIVLREYVGKNGAPSVYLDAGVYRELPDGTKKKVDARLKADGKNPLPAVGQRVSLTVHKVQPSSARLDVKIMTQTSWYQKVMEDVEQAKWELSTLEVGQKVSGTIVKLVPAGALLDVGAYMKKASSKSSRRPVLAMLMKDHFARNVGSAADAVRSSSIVDVLQTNDRIDVYVRRVLPSNGRLRVSMNPVTPEQVKAELENFARKRRQRAEMLKVTGLQVGQELVGKVCDAPQKTFGVLVNVGAKKNGLLHVNNIPKAWWGERWKSELTRNETIFVKIQSVNLATKTFALELVGTLKLLEQQVLEDARNNASVSFNALKRAMPTSEPVVMSAFVETKVRELMSEDARAELEELEKGVSPVPVALTPAVAATSTAQVVEQSRDVIKVPLESTNASPVPVANVGPTPSGEAIPTRYLEDEEDEGEDEFGDEYFENKYG